MKTSKKIDIEEIEFSHYISRDRVQEYNLTRNSLIKVEDRVKLLCEQAQNDYEEELEKAYSDGIKKAENEWLQRKLSHSKHTIIHLIAIEEKLISIVEHALTHIIGDYTPAEAIQKAIVKQVKELRLENSINLRLHPDISDDVIQSFSNSEEQYDYINIIPDQGIKDQQEFILETPSGNIDSSISKQIEEIIQSIKENF